MNRSKQQRNRRQSARRSSRKLRQQQSKKRQLSKQSKRRQSKSRQSSKVRRSKKVQRGGNYFLNVDAQRIGGLAEVARVDAPIAPLAGASNQTYPTPLYQQPQQQTVNVSPAPAGEYSGNGMNSVFHDTMTQRDFSCKGPQWQPTCI
jgi:hypothetical protein